MEKINFDKEKSEELALKIVDFLKKWGMFSDVQIMTSDRRYYDEDGVLVVKDEPHSERILDMNFEGPLYGLLVNHEYEVAVKDVSHEARAIVIPHLSDFEDEETDLLSNFMDFLRANDLNGKERESLTENDWNSVYDVLDKLLINSDRFDDATYFGDGEVASLIVKEFCDLLESYGLWYDQDHSWSLTTYRRK